MAMVDLNVAVVWCMEVTNPNPLSIKQITLMDENEIGLAMRLPPLIVFIATLFTFAPANANDSHVFRVFLAKGWKTSGKTVSHEERNSEVQSDSSSADVVILFSGAPQKLVPTEGSISLKTIQNPKGDTIQLPASTDQAIEYSVRELKSKSLRTIARDHGFGLFDTGFLNSYDD